VAITGAAAAAISSREVSARTVRMYSARFSAAYRYCAARLQVVDGREDGDPGGRLATSWRRSGYRLRVWTPLPSSPWPAYRARSRAAIGPIITARLASANEHRARLRDARTTLYVDINVATSAAERFINAVTNSDRRRELSRARKPEGWETLDARIYLLAPDELRSAWRESIEAMERLEWHVFEESGIGPDPLLGYLEEGAPLVVAARTGIRRVFELTRAAAEQG